MTDYGVTPAGFVRKPFEVIADELRTKLRATWGTAADLSPDSDLGQLVDAFALEVAEVWEVAEASYAAYDPDQAEDASLDAVMALTGSEREAATYTSVLVNVTVDPGTYAIGDLVASVTGDPTRRFANTEEVVNAGATSATVLNVDFRAENTGPLACNAGTLEVMASAVSGWTAVTNVADAYVLGTDIEKDAPARARREQELGSQGSTTVVAIRADLLAIEHTDGSKPVENVRVLENVTDATDANGLLPHSVEAIVHAPSATDEEIAEAIFTTVAGGIATNGTTSVNVTDEQGEVHAIKFSRATTLEVYVEVSLTVNLDTYAGEEAVQIVYAAKDAGMDPGERLLWTKIIDGAYDVAGVESIDDFGISTSPSGPFTAANITPTVRQVINIDSANVTVIL